MRRHRLIRGRGAGAVVLVGASLLVLGGARCATQRSGQQAARPSMQVLAATIEGDVVVERFDLDGDGRPDVFKHWRVVRQGGQVPAGTRLLARREVDLDFDGKVDMITEYDVQGRVALERLDLDFDGRFDAVDHYENGQLVLREMELGYDQRPKVWKYYENGQLVRKERDLRGEGRPQEWEYFDGGRLVRIGRDVDGDGKPEVFTDVTGGGS